MIQEDFKDPLQVFLQDPTQDSVQDPIQDPIQDPLQEPLQDPLQDPRPGTLPGTLPDTLDVTCSTRFKGQSEWGDWVTWNTFVWEIEVIAPQTADGEIF